MTTHDTTAGRTTRPRVAREHRRAVLLWTLVVPVLLLGAAVAVVAAWAPELPETPASHWGPGGVADGFSPLPELVAATLGAAVVVALVMWLIARTYGSAAMTRRITAAASVWTAAFTSALLLTLLAGQRGLADASAARPDDGGTAIALVAATVLAVLVAWAVPGDLRLPARSTVPQDAARLPLDPTQTATWHAVVGPRRTWWLVAAAIAFGAFIGAVTAMWWFGLVLAALLAATLVVTLRWEVTIDRTGLTARTLLPRPRLHVPVDEVEVAEVVEIDPFRDFGGWGLRTGAGGRTGVVLRRGPAVLVRQTGGREVVVTTPDAATGVALLNTLAARSR